MVTDGTITYTVPQRIDLGPDDTLIRVFFRVRAPRTEPARVVVRSSGEPVASFKKPFMVPGEMQHIRLPRQLLEKARNNTLTLSVEEA